MTMKYIVFSIVMVAIMVAGVGGSTSTAHAMNKAELIEAMASKAGLSKADSKKALEGFLDAGTDALKKGDRLSLIGFGSFSVSKRAERGGSVNEVEFFPEVRSKGAEKRHAGETVTGEEIVKILSDRCAKESKEREGEARCPAYEKMLDALISVTSDELVRGEFVEWGTEEWGDFGTLQSAMATSISKRSARTGRNPQTGKEIKIAAKNTVKFKAGAELSKAVN